MAKTWSVAEFYTCYMVQYWSMVAGLVVFVNHTPYQFQSRLVALQISNQLSDSTANDGAPGAYDYSACEDCCNIIFKDWLQGRHRQTNYFRGEPWAVPTEHLTDHQLAYADVKVSFTQLCFMCATLLHVCMCALRWSGLLQVPLQVNKLNSWKAELH